jgi:hypothetical protein
VLPGFPDAALWVVITIYIVGGLMIYFGWISRGRQRVIGMLIGILLVGYAAYPPASRYLDSHPELRACINHMWAEKTLSCDN